MLLEGLFLVVEVFYIHDVIEIFYLHLFDIFGFELIMALRFVNVGNVFINVGDWIFLLKVAGMITIICTFCKLSFLISDNSLSFNTIFFSSYYADNAFSLLE